MNRQRDIQEINSTGLRSRRATVAGYVTALFVTGLLVFPVLVIAYYLESVSLITLPRYLAIPTALIIAGIYLLNAVQLTRRFRKRLSK